MLSVKMSLRAKRGVESGARQRSRMTLVVLLWGALAVVVLGAGAARATPAHNAVGGGNSRPAPTATSGPRHAAAKTTKVVHSPYALAAAADSAAPKPGSPVKGHSATMLQGLGTAGMHKHSVNRPH
jgi:hypothetical protein